jgi:hypothetical protein
MSKPKPKYRYGPWRLVDGTVPKLPAGVRVQTVLVGGRFGGSEAGRPPTAAERRNINRGRSVDYWSFAKAPPSGHFRGEYNCAWRTVEDVT